MPVRNASMPREKSSWSYTSWAVFASGAPSRKLSVPMRVWTVSGVVIFVGTSAAYFGAFCAQLGAYSERSTASAITPE
jgi:hypothetical protein